MATTNVDDFVVDWPKPEDANLSWGRDRAHAPDPMPPLAGIFGTLASHGFTHAFGFYSIPVKALRVEVFNCYAYTTVEPLDVAPDVLEAKAKEAEGKIVGVMPQIADLWANTYLPEIKQILAEIDSVDLDAASSSVLVGHWNRQMELQRRLYEIHFEILLPSMMAVSEFDELYRKLVESPDPYAAYRLLQGFDNLTLATGRALWELSRRAVEHADVLRAIEENDTSQVIPALESFETGRAFVTELRAYLDDYGQRGDKWDITYPSWIEDPAPVIANLKRYVHQDEHPAAELERATAERDRLVAEARETLADNPMLPMFEFLLKAAQEGIVISEDHGFWIDFRGGYRARLLCLAVGRRLKDVGVIDDVDDIFFVYPEEIVSALEEPADRRDVVAERRAELEHARSITPPLYVGAAESPMPEDNPIARAFNKFGGERPPSPAGARELSGNPGAPGVARGTARIIRTIADADRLEPGDVLVAETTSPPWTPFFAIASAVVTDSGGVLGHCAVVAREYQIPAVVGCTNATDLISDGQTIEVDGTAGVVKLC